ncbi:hypothetical protein [Synechococcus elongatus]|uniref:hypothetical protein n=1 Tax=Synechococcus elongatus TaxID=32046 RepID=UPI000F7E752D|nr:hypothetical protein [Synechococcus elongatus]
MRRLIDCPGSAQLVAAIAALRSQGLQADRYCFSGWAPRDRFAAFSAEVARMATQLQPGLTGSAIAPERFTSWLGRSLSALEQQQLRQEIGLETVDELWLATGWRPKEQLLRQLYPTARCLCYGDGLGVYVAADSVLQQRRGWRSRLRSWWSPATKPLPADGGHFIFSGDRQPPFPSQPVPLSDLEDCLHTLANALPTQAIASLRQLTAQREWGVLLTANLSEQADGAYISLTAEIEAYRQFLADQSLPSALLLKPHPRDSATKLQQLTTAIADLGVEPLVLQDSQLAFWPIEVILLSLLPDLQGLPVFTVSSAAVPLQALGADVQLGFGGAIVRRQFTRKGQRLRRHEEQQLQRWLQVGNGASNPRL